jgi:hypothetical protein
LDEQRTTNNEQRTTNNEQRTTNNEQRTTMIIRFAIPIGGETGWIISSDITLDNNIIGYRGLYEVGDDYFCIQDKEEGVREIRCMPYFNVIEVSFTRTD